jgi:hypothetical protein
MARGDRVASASGTMTELTRDYEVNRDVYKELLKRRENAQVAMSMDSEKRGLTFRVLEPAAIPLQPSGGLRLMHVAGIGLFLAVIAPLLFVFGMLKVDNRVRSPAQVEQLAGTAGAGHDPDAEHPASARRHQAQARHRLHVDPGGAAGLRVGPVRTMDTRPMNSPRTLSQRNDEHDRRRPTTRSARSWSGTR